MSVPLVTVAMSVHNAESTLESALQSILWQTFPDWELIVMDDGSTDQTSRILSRFTDQRVRVVRGEDGQKGLAVRLNQCIQLAKGKYIARMDADDISYPERFDRQVRYLESHPDTDLLGHGAVVFRGAGRVLGLYPTACNHEEICRCPWWGFSLAHPTWMGKRSWFVLNRYREALIKGQDQDLLLRSYRTSHFAALPEILLGYRNEHVSANKTAQGRYYYCRTLVSEIHDAASASVAVRGVAVHALGFGRDLFGGVVGARAWLFPRRRTEVDAAILEQWRTVWGTLNGGRAPH